MTTTATKYTAKRPLSIHGDLIKENESFYIEDQPALGGFRVFISGATHRISVQEISYLLPYVTTLTEEQTGLYAKR